MFSFYSSVCNLLAPKPKTEIDQYTKRSQDYNYIVSKNEANETVILEVPKIPKLSYTYTNFKK